MRIVRYVAAAVVLPLAAAWLVGARRGGFLGVDSHAVVPAPDEPETVEVYGGARRWIQIGEWRVAYVDEGSGPPVLLLHGCPFSSYEWHAVIPILARQYRVIAPDLLGLGDTVVRLDDDYRLPNQLAMVVGLLDGLGVHAARVVGHDHGGATAELMMKHHPERIERLVLTNVEAYDQWPSAPETPYLRALLNPLSGPLFRLIYDSSLLQHEAYSSAFKAPESVSQEMLDAFVRPQTATAERYARTRRFLGWQMDRDHNLETMRALDGMRKFDRPTLLLWGKHDTNFGPAIAERLAKDIPGASRIQWMENSAHLPMLEEPEAYAAALMQFFAEDAPSSLTRRR
jgi:pimeloyl-ACP methyl ester carboxylesterase